jgi:hypothetical protein
LIGTAAAGVEPPEGAGPLARADSLAGVLEDLNTAANPEVRPPSRRRFWLLGVGLVVLVVAALLLASQQGSGGGGGGPLNAIAEAAVKTQAEGGGRAFMRGTVAGGDLAKPIVMTGRIAYDADGMSRGTVTFPNPKTGKLVKLEAVQDKAHMYMRSSSFGTLPDGREWMGIDFSFGDELETPVPGGSDAKGELELLEKVTGGVARVGSEKVRGVMTTRYRGRISVADNAKRLRELGADTMASDVEKVGAPVQVEAWIDGKGLVRRMGIAQTKPGEEGEGPTTVHMRMDFFDFGYEPEIEIPDSGEVFDATSVTQEQIEATK